MIAYLNIAYNYPLGSELFESNTKTKEELIRDFLTSRGFSESNISELKVIDTVKDWHNGIDRVDAYIKIKEEK